MLIRLWKCDFFAYYCARWTNSRVNKKLGLCRFLFYVEIYLNVGRDRGGFLPENRRKLQQTKDLSFTTPRTVFGQLSFTVAETIHSYKFPLYSNKIFNIEKYRIILNTQSRSLLRFAFLWRQTKFLFQHISIIHLFLFYYC